MLQKDNRTFRWTGIYPVENEIWNQQTFTIRGFICVIVCHVFL